MEYYNPSGFALEIFQKRYTLHDKETWLEACDRVSTHVAMAESGESIVKYRQEFSEVLKKNLFMPGGRIWYGAGRSKGQCLNCFVIPTSDSREGWGKSVSDEIVISGTGGGIGTNFSPIRPRGSTISGSGGIATGAVSLMQIYNAAGEVIKAGGGRRTALMMCLGLTHGDIEEFLDTKLDKKQLNNANVSVMFDENPEEFFDLVKKNGTLELKFNGKVVGKIPAKRIWNKIVSNALQGGEPGLLNGYLANKMNNIAYYAPLICTNPCFAPGTMIQTKNGHYPIESLVGKTIDIWNGNSWQSIDNFRVTGENQEILKITFSDGSFERVTPYHTVILEDGNRIKAKDVIPDMKFALSNSPLVHGDIKVPGAYLKGFLVGDGTLMVDRPFLMIYEPKYGCIGRLLESAQEMPVEEINTNAIEELKVGEVSYNRVVLKGLTARKSQLQKWCKEYKQNLPKEIFSWDLRSKLEFIAGTMDADGSASDTKNGFMYQLYSINQLFLNDFQLLLKTVGVRSNLTLSKKGGSKDFGPDRGGVCETQDCWRLTISQFNSVTLAKQVNFSRLVSFANKKIHNIHKPKHNKVISVEKDGIEEKVYCCTVEGTHALSLSTGIYWGQCGEIFLAGYDCCCLGALVLPKFIVNKEINYKLLKETIQTAVRFLDDVLTVNNYPLPEIKEMCSNIRRIGLGVMGLSTMLLELGMRYNSSAGLELVNKVMNFIKNAAYEASIELAKEKGAFPKFDADQFLKSGFCKTLRPTLREQIKEHGMRNCALLTIAPTGTTSIVCDVDSGIEPSFGPAWVRKYRDGEALKTEIVIHPLFRKMLKEKRSVKHFQSAYDLKIKDHLEMQRICQKHLDNACSKTVNLPPGTSASDLSDLYMEYFPDLKGITVYPEGSREDQPITPLSLEEAMKHIDTANDADILSQDNCRNGVCEI